MSDEGVLINIKVTLDRIATALEQMALERGADRAPLFGFVNSDPNRPVDQEPPLPTPPADLPSFGQQIAASGPISHADAIANAPQSATVALPPVQPFQFTGPSAQASVPGVRWAAGMNHAAGHKPLKENNRGLYCPTKMPDGTWCQFTVAK